MPNTDLSDAIVSAIKADAGLSAQLTGGVWSGFAPPTTVPPYLVVVEVGESPQYSSVDASSATPYMDMGQIQLSIFTAAGKSDAKALGLSVERALQDANLVFSTGALLKLRRTFRTTMVDPEPFRDGSYVWHHVLTFDTVVQRAI